MITYCVSHTGLGHATEATIYNGLSQCRSMLTLALYFGWVVELGPGSSLVPSCGFQTKNLNSFVQLRAICGIPDLEKAIVNSFFCLLYVCEITQSCLTLCNPMDCSLLGSSVHGILQARILQWVAILFSRGSSWPRDRTKSNYKKQHFFFFFINKQSNWPQIKFLAI